ncbi:MAG: CoA transferase [Alphaproteobacteria bacterium]|nr:CoA transferase [Alphaproteobacteria bacterium]MBU0802747.1 CoA transferase [Alphaproteobacteria bacterium]MBU0871544.1 CoA transferase [Alphaproteobacteria bacterium]MBU1400211.1 CoA transferase [Alphaproteobacteria bacterium]MBU1591331.1 CoA transferase [Alphaproteobacteria bacterium]
MSRPLDGLLVVSLEQAIAAPYCTRLLADQGARVIKVERPDGGDFARAYDTRARGLASHFVWTNRSKESLALDLKEERAVEGLKKILASADVFVQNLAPGAAARLGLGPGQLRADNPRLITCSISGYGRSGPDEKRKAYDLLIQAEAGFLSVTGTRDEMAKSGISIADISAGVTAYHSILSALIHRGRSGVGDNIEVSMLEAMAEWMGFPMYFAMDGAAPPQRNGAGHATIYPYGPYKTADGGVMLGLQNDREWTAFATDVLQRSDLAGDDRFKGNSGRANHRDVLEPVILATFSTLNTEEAIARLERAGIATARISDMAALWAHPQLAARQRWGEIGSPAGPLPALKPVSGDGWEPRLDPVPALGEHTETILAEFGLDSLFSTKDSA